MSFQKLALTALIFILQELYCTERIMANKKFSTIHGTVEVLYYKIGTMHSDSCFFYFLLLKKTYVALQKVLLTCTIITLYKICEIFYFCFIPSQTKLMPVPTHVFLFFSFFIVFCFSNYCIVFRLFIYLSCFVFFLYLVLTSN